MEVYSVSQVDWTLQLTPSTDSPIIMSVPHDGLPRSDFEGLFVPRNSGHHCRDMYVWNFVRDILTHHPSYGIRGLLPRKFVDYNRAWPQAINYYPLTQAEAHTALDDERLVTAWETYHRSIESNLSRCISKFGVKRTLLIDMHGFIKQPEYAPHEGFDLILGTGNRITIPYGNPDEQLANYMTERGYHVFLPQPQSIGPLEDVYAADFTTRHHAETSRVNAIQIEIANKFRTKHGRDAGIKLAQCFAEFFATIS